MSHPLADALGALLGPDAGVGYSIVAGPEGLFPEETPAVLRAVPRRQAEFAAGRRAARAAMGQLGYPARAIPKDDHRAPVWPGGLVGAITHDAGLALAAVLPGNAASGLGVDLTEAAALPGRTRAEILPDPREEGLSFLEARTAFSAKESLFKALFPLVGAYFGFSSALFHAGTEPGKFRIELTRPLGPFAAGAAWVGHSARDDHRILTALRLPLAQ